MGWSRSYNPPLRTRFVLSAAAAPFRIALRPEVAVGPPAWNALGLGKDAVTLTQAIDHDIRGLAPAALPRWRPAALLVGLGVLCCALADQPASAEIVVPMPRESTPISIRADRANRWTQGTYEVWVLRDEVEIRQGGMIGRAREAVLWVDRADPLSGQASKILAYLEGDVRIDHEHSGHRHQSTGRSANTVRDQSWWGRFYSSTHIAIDASLTGFEPKTKPAIYERGLAAWEAEAQGPVRPVQYNQPMPAYTPLPLPSPQSQPGILAQPNTVAPPYGYAQPGMPTLPGSTPAASSPPVWSPPEVPGSVGGIETIPAPIASAVPARSLIVRSRSNVRMQGRVFPSPNGSETIAVISSGVNVIVGGMDGLPGMSGDKIDIETDRIVIWTARLDRFDLTGNSSGEKLQPRDAPLEFYLEGNVVFREGDRVIYAERMYYNVRRRYGTVLNAEILSPAPGYQGLVRLKADVLQQLDQFNFQAFNAAVTSSRMGVPAYWLQAGQVTFQDIQTPRTDPLTGQIASDLVTGDIAVDHQYMATSRNNFLFAGGLPVLYWPVMATDLSQPNFYLDSLTVRNDDIFGFQIFSDWNMYQLLGMRSPPEGTQWTFSPDYLSKRGFALGTEVEYDRFGFFTIPGPVTGHLDAWGIQDRGTDNLGLDRRSVVPTTDTRGRVLWHHRQYLPGGFQFTAEVGWISDFNFLEQYYEQEWDEGKDQTTGLELKRFVDHSSWALAASFRPNDFVTQTEWLPRFDHFLIGQSFFDRFTYFAHSHVGYARLKRGFLPQSVPIVGEPDETPLPWEVDSLGSTWDTRSGLHTATRHELDLPLPVGPFKFTPYVLGELAYWDQDIDGRDVSRAYGQAGIRGSLPLWSADPNVRNSLLNLNGMAHKVTLDADVFWADSDQQMKRFPLYEPLDDDSTEHFQRRFIQYEYTDLGLDLPRKFDARDFAFRSGMQNWVTAPSTEIVDDLVLATVGLRQRWQTKRGPPGQERVIDWVVLDVEGSFFPEQDRDNFGQLFGMLNYDFRWHLGDRFTLLSDGFFDFFDSGLQTASIGGLISRPQRGNVYLGFRTMNGPFKSDVVRLAVNYRMSRKWIANAGGTIALGDTGNVSENVSFTRIGESLLVRVGVYADQSRDNVGVNFSIEPRFLSGSLSRVGGVPISPIGAFGLE